KNIAEVETHIWWHNWRAGAVMKLNIKNTSELALPPGSRDAVFWDDDIAGFGIRIRAGGSRNWVYRYRIGKKQRAIKLGSANAVPLAVARKNASELAAKIALGADPALDKETARSEADNTFGVLAHQYLEARKSKWRPKSRAHVTRHLLKYAKPLHRLPITAVSQRNVANLLAS